MSKIAVLIFVPFLTVLALGLPNPKPAGKPGYCHNAGVDIKEGEGVAAPLGSCAQLTCRNAAKNDISGLPCGLIAPPKKGCKVKLEDLTKPYPNCCASTVCGGGT